MSDDEEDLLPCTPEELRAVAEETAYELLPQESKDRYIAVYNKFKNWRSEKWKTSSASENVLYAYFLELTKENKPPTLWSKYSMLRQLSNTSKM